MKNLLIALVAVIILSACLVFFKAIPHPATKTISSSNRAPSPTVTSAPSTDTPTPSTQYSPAVRAEVRAEFIRNCTNHFGQKYLSACNCGADYLTKNYTEAQLAKIYIAYHATGKLSPEIQKAIDACSK